MRDTLEEQIANISVIDPHDMTLREAVGESAFNNLMQLIEADRHHHIARTRLAVWQEIRKGDGLYRTGDGCFEISVDYIDEQIAEIGKSMSTRKEAK